MWTHLDTRDLIIRGFVISLTSLFLLFVTRDETYDLHFKIRKAQPTSPSVTMVEVPSSLTFSQIIPALKQSGAQLIFAHKSVVKVDDPQLVPYVTGDPSVSALNLHGIADKDGLVRTCEVLLVPEHSNIGFKINTPLTINFRGPTGTFPVTNYYDISQNSADLRGRYIVIKEEIPRKNFTTPVGILSEAELVANIIDNTIEDRFFPEKNLLLAILILVIILLITAGFLIYLPSSLALISTISFAILYTSASLWLFDNFYFWTPILVPAIQMFLTMILILNYKYILNEKTKWDLEKESRYFNEVEEMKTNFLSLFSHDLKTPLAKIIGISDTLKSKISDPELLSEIEKIHHSSKDLEKYIKRILKMSQVQSKNISLNKTPVDINSLIEKSIAQNKLLAQEKNIIIEKKLSPLFLVEIDGPLVQEVIVNFLENAITYSPEGSTVTLASEEVNNYIKVTVTDQGKGVPKEVQESIWERYYRFNKDKPGYGLGLFLSRYVIQLHDGQVFLNSKENKGSEFGFIIPIKEDEL